MFNYTTVTTVPDALTALRVEAYKNGYDCWEAVAETVAERIQGFDHVGRPLRAPKELVRKVRNELVRMVRSGKIFARVTKGVEQSRRGNNSRHTVRRKWYSTLVKEA